MWLYLIQGLGLGLAAAAQPGPFQAYLLSQSLRHGWRKALPAAFAPLLSDGPIITLTLFVLSQIPPWLQQGLYFAGGMFILFLAVRAYRAWQNYVWDANALSTSQAKTVWRAALMNLLNPSPYIYWSFVTGPILLSGWRTTPGFGVVFLIAFYASLLSGLALVIIVFGASRKLGPKVNRALLGISGIVLGCFGMFQLWLGLQSLISG